MESEVAQLNRAKAAAPAVGWIGAGKMGAPMARHLLAAGADLVVVDQSTREVAATIAGGRLSHLSGRAALRVDIAPGWSADVIVLGQDTEAEDSQYADRRGARLVSSAQVTEGSRAQYGQGQLVITGQIGEVRIKSSTGIGAQDLTERYDATEPGGPPRLFRQRNETRMIANETRIWQPVGEQFGWVLGTSVIDNRNTLTRALGPAGEPAAAATGVENTVFEITGYGEASYRLLPSVTLAAGLRITVGTPAEMDAFLAAARAWSEG